MHGDRGGTMGVMFGLGGIQRYQVLECGGKVFCPVRT